MTTKVAECVLSPHLCRPPCFEALNPSFFTHPFLVPPRLLPLEILHGRLRAPSLFLEVTYLFHCRYSRSCGRHQRRSPCRTSCSRGCERRPSNAKSDERPWRPCKSVKGGLSRKQKCCFGGRHRTREEKIPRQLEARYKHFDGFLPIFFPGTAPAPPRIRLSKSCGFIATRASVAATPGRRPYVIATQTRYF